MNQRTNRAYLLIGGNLGNRQQLLAAAITLIAAQCGTIVQCSSVYETEAWGLTEQPLFLNQAVALDTVLQPEQLLQALLRIELQLGRQRKEKYGPRLMDIDILLFGNAVVEAPALVIPHPHMASRRFVLAPLAELIPQYVHPVLQKTIQDLLARCPDPLQVYKLQPG